MKGYIKVVMFIFLTSYLIGQDTYTPSEKSAFVHIYMEAKSGTTTKTENELKKLLNDHNISNKRYREIFSKRLHQQTIDLTKTEEAFFNKIDQAEKKHSRIKSQNIKEKCKSRNISLPIYEQILHLYKTDLPFQRSLKPYFDQYLKSIKR